jgi:hypothetical protein
VSGIGFLLILASNSRRSTGAFGVPCAGIVDNAFLIGLAD